MGPLICDSPTMVVRKGAGRNSACKTSKIGSKVESVPIKTYVTGKGKKIGVSPNHGGGIRC